MTLDELEHELKIYRYKKKTLSDKGLESVADVNLLIDYRMEIDRLDRTIEKKRKEELSDANR